MSTAVKSGVVDLILSIAYTSMVVAACNVDQLIVTAPVSPVGTIAEIVAIEPLPMEVLRWIVAETPPIVAEATVPPASQ